MRRCCLGARSPSPGPTLTGGVISFGGAAFIGGNVTFDGVTFTDSEVNFVGATAAGGSVSRDGQPFWGWPVPAAPPHR